ncbi:MAG: N,N-dimethylformamidase beta subunit family domain-containing protein, partial [Candidatus Binataceae bacterium]
MPNIHGYSDKISVASGERIRFMVSVEDADRYRAEIVRLIHGDANPDGPGFKDELIHASASGEYPGRFQPVRAGSHIVIEDPGALLDINDALTVHAFVKPTTPAKGLQGIVTRWDAQRRTGWALMIDDQRRPALWLGDGAGHLLQFAAPVALLADVWYAAGASYDGARGSVIIRLEPVINSVNSLIGPVATIAPAMTHRATVERIDFRSSATAVIAGWCGMPAATGVMVDGHYNGKIDRPRVYRRALNAAELAELSAGREPDGNGLLARWDFADGIGPAGIPSDHVSDVSSNGLHGRCVNMPARAVTGYNWSGREEHFTHAPTEYGAIHFHDDDLEDAGWEPSFELTVPETMRSGVYAACVRAGNASDYIPFFVRAARPQSEVVFLAPTASYMAYANEQLAFGVGMGAIMGRMTLIQAEDIYLHQHPELGLSTYDHHAD